MMIQQQSLWTMSRRDTSRSLPSVYFAENVHVGLARPRLGLVVMVTVSSTTCMQRCIGDGTASLFACCGSCHCSKSQASNSKNVSWPQRLIDDESTVVLLVFCFSTVVCKDPVTQSLRPHYDLSATDFLLLVWSPASRPTVFGQSPTSRRMFDDRFAFSRPLVGG